VSGALALRPQAPLWNMGVPPLSIATVVGLQLPLCYVVEPDVMWAEQAIEALLEERVGAGAVASEGAVVARWTRGRGWVCASGFGFGLSGAESSSGSVGDELVRLAAVLATGVRGGGSHPLDGSLFSVRGMQPEIEDLASAEILLDLVRQLAERSATLLIELHAVPEPCPGWNAAARLGPVLPLEIAPHRRYASALLAVREAAAAMNLPEPDHGDVLALLLGLTQLQAVAAARLTRSVCVPPHDGLQVLDVLAACCDRVKSVMEGDT
jgi:hypothetical protein